MAIVKSIKNFHHYLYGRPFKVRTDHGSLTLLVNFKNPEGEIPRWFELLSQYEFKVEHRAGRSHSNADALSRRPCPLDCKHCNKAEEKYEPNLIFSSCSSITMRAQSTAQNNLPDIDPHAQKLDIKESQNQDPIIKTVIEWVKSKDRPKWEEISHLSEANKYYWVRYDSLKFLNGILYHIWEGVRPK